jgi:DNA-binding transcriptional LysR family regulator
MKQLSWDDLRFLLAVARARTLRRASQQAGISAASLSRRIDELEEALGEKLLERFQTGCTPTPAGVQVLAWAEQMERVALEMTLTRERSGNQVAEGTVVINTDEWMSYFLTTRFAGFRSRYPRMQVEVVTSHRPFNLTRREADISIRSFRPKQLGIATRKIGTISFGLYCSSAYRKLNTEALASRDWAGLALIGFDDRRSDLAADQWLRSLPDAPLPWLRCSYALGIYDGVTSGSGLGVLANFIAEEDPELYPVIAHISSLDQEVWLSVHKGHRSSPHIRVTLDYIGSLFR